MPERNADQTKGGERPNRGYPGAQKQRVVQPGHVRVGRSPALLRRWPVRALQRPHWGEARTELLATPPLPNEVTTGDLADAKFGAVRDVDGMPNPNDDADRLHVLIVDEHDVYRSACAALLRTEGLDVTEIVPGAPVTSVARALKPCVVLIDAASPFAWLREEARQLRSLPGAPTLMLMSSAGRDRLDDYLADLPFLAKADVCARELLRAHGHDNAEASSGRVSG